MRRTAIAITGLALAALPAASASADDSSTLQSYSLLRVQLKECNLDTNWHQLSTESRAECNDLFRDYVLFYIGEASYIHCRSSSSCIPTPDGFPAADGAIPDGAVVYDTKPQTTPRKSAAKSAGHRRHRHHRH